MYRTNENEYWAHTAGWCITVTKNVFFHLKPMRLSSRSESDAAISICYQSVRASEWLRTVFRYDPREGWTWEVAHTSCLLNLKKSIIFIRVCSWVPTILEYWLLGKCCGCYGVMVSVFVGSKWWKWFLNYSQIFFSSLSAFSDGA